MKKIERYDNIDLIKFFAILFVVMYHANTVSYNFLDCQNIETYINYFIKPILSTCVPLFFFVNGFLLINKNFNLKKHIIKIISIIITSIIWMIINMIFMIPIDGYSLSITEFVQNLWSQERWINHFWFMGALICIYIIFPLIKIAFDNSKSAFNYYVIICLILSYGNKLFCMILTILNYIITENYIYIDMNLFNIFNPFRGIYGHTFACFCVGCFIGGNSSFIYEKMKKNKFFNNMRL